MSTVEDDKPLKCSIKCLYVQSFCGVFWGVCSYLPSIRSTIISAFLLGNSLAKTESLEAASMAVQMTAVYAWPMHCQSARRWYSTQAPATRRVTWLRPLWKLAKCQPRGTRLLPTRQRGLCSITKKVLKPKGNKVQKFLLALCEADQKFSGQCALGSVLIRDVESKLFLESPRATPSERKETRLLRERK